MKPLAILSGFTLAVICATQLLAQGQPDQITIEQHGADHAPFATIHMRNLHGGGGTYTYTFETPHGTVVVEHVITKNEPGGCCADTLSVVALPDGVLARPMFMEIQEGETGAVELFRWLGG
ncbi:hypothetical protein [Maritimibacter sp. UBA3975]|uniref:hypothetical protein n=1 Tax=Maritimibacter sp. UBA3975 TaxID=1946833 RepID=UPI000C0ADB21|nr:hypothetical protein [Maritimibacter sp. UBA3975]MAM60822.1 hypothetical protein [Maritimibacter sp.]|tara:strand:+ start:10578 stop:10940 length:363 start_codon:yes stop_codon:yes gene_type:complete